MSLPPNIPSSPRRSSRIAHQRDQISSSDTQPSDTVSQSTSMYDTIYSIDTSSDDNSTGPIILDSSTSSNDNNTTVSTVPIVDSSTLVNELRESRITEEGAVGGTEEPRGPLLDCAICLQPCVHPAKLPCSHIFCFLCLKGFAQQSRRCAMCRTPIPHNYLERPELVQVPEPSSLENGYQWFYEGRNGGWWRYEERMSDEIEQNYSANAKDVFETLICGEVYVVDLGQMIQFSKYHPNRSRKIKRELLEQMGRQCKGVAGIH